MPNGFKDNFQDLLHDIKSEKVMGYLNWNGTDADNKFKSESISKFKKVYDGYV